MKWNHLFFFFLNHTCIVQLSDSIFFVSSISKENELSFLTVCFTRFPSVYCLCSLFIFHLECLTVLLVTFWQHFLCFRSVTEYVSICLPWINNHVTTHPIDSSLMETTVSSSINDTQCKFKPFFSAMKTECILFHASNL